MYEGGYRPQLPERTRLLMARILIIDDDDMLRTVLAKALVLHGHEVIEATDGRQGVEIARVASVELVITDVIMPVQEGVGTIRKLRSEKQSLPIMPRWGAAAIPGSYLI